MDKYWSFGGTCYLHFTYLTYLLSLLQEHRPSVKHLQLILIWAKAPNAFQVFSQFPSLFYRFPPCPLRSPSRRPSEFQQRTCLSIACESALKVCPIHFLSLTWWIIGFCFAICQRCSFETVWGQKNLKIILMHLCIMVFDRLCGLVVRVLGYRSGGPGSIFSTIMKKSTGSGTGSTQPREYNWGTTW
jgi:hypothetical protein